jgi:hypothetical protein
MTTSKSDVFGDTNLVTTIYPLFDANATRSYEIAVQHVTAHPAVVCNSST